MLESTENQQAHRIIALKIPNYRHAYSDHMAWVMARASLKTHVKGRDGWSGPFSF